MGIRGDSGFLTPAQLRARVAARRLVLESWAGDDELAAALRGRAGLAALAACVGVQDARWRDGQERLVKAVIRGGGTDGTESSWLFVLLPGGGKTLAFTFPPVLASMLGKRRLTLEWTNNS